MMGRRQGMKPTRERGPALQYSMPKPLQFSMPIDTMGDVVEIVE